jgi:cytochrome c-type biogenesis protein
MALDIGIFGAFVAGILSFVSPCVLPLVPPYLAFLAGTGIAEIQGAGGITGATRRRILIQAACFVAGFSTIFVLLGASATWLGQNLTRYFEGLAIAAGLLIIAMGLHFLGVFRLSLLYREVRVSVARKPAGPLGAYAMGLAFAFGWTPCVGPILAAILMVASAEETAMRGATLLAAYSLGIGLPFLAAAFLAGPFIGLLNRLKAHLGLIEKAMGVLLVVTGLLFLTGSMPKLAYWLLDTFPILSKIG